MTLAEVFPRDEVIERVGEELEFSEYSLEDLDELVACKSASLFELGAAIWDRYFRGHPYVNPQQFSDHFDNDDPMLFQAIADWLGETTVDELYYVHVELADTTVDYRTVAELLVAQAYPNVMHVSDVEFSNPRQPIPAYEQQYAHQHFRGLGLLPVLVANIVEFGQQHGRDEVCLTAAHIDLVPLFEQHGFTVDDTPAGHFGLQAGASIPMSRPLD